MSPLLPNLSLPGNLAHTGPTVLRWLFSGISTWMISAGIVSLRTHSETQFAPSLAPSTIALEFRLSGSGHVTAILAPVLAILELNHGAEFALVNTIRAPKVRHRRVRADEKPA
jgi:hypothetical protein